MTDQESGLQAIGQGIEDALSLIYGQRMGFALLVFTFGEPEGGGADYISNAVREDMIQHLRDTANRLEAREDIPRTEGSA
jgi:hypothetical protein